MNIRAKWLFTLMLIAIVFILTILTLMQQQVHTALKIETIPDLGMGTKLNQLVENLEKEITERNSYEVTMNNDPLRLRHVIPKLAYKLPVKPQPRNHATIRLISTIITPEQSIAIIRYKGRRFNLMPGQRIAGFKIVKMDFDHVILENDSAKITLTEKPIVIQKDVPVDSTKTQLDTLQL